MHAAGAEWETHNRVGDAAYEWENEQIGTFPDVEVSQTPALVLAGEVRSSTETVYNNSLTYSLGTSNSCGIYIYVVYIYIIY